MDHDERVKDVMLPLEDHPRIPASSTVAEALIEIREYIHRGYRHVLVFDERFNLLSILALKDILKSLLPDFTFDHAPEYQGFALPDESALALLWQDAFYSECKKRGSRSVREILRPVKTTIDANAPVIQALYLMLRDDVNMLPVVRNNVVIGVIRIINILDMVFAVCNIETCEEEK